jgi:hypothetical protein
VSRIFAAHTSRAAQVSRIILRLGKHPIYPHPPIELPCAAALVCRPKGAAGHLAVGASPRNRRPRHIPKAPTGRQWTFALSGLMPPSPRTKCHTLHPPNDVAAPVIRRTTC